MSWALARKSIGSLVVVFLAGGGMVSCQKAKEMLESASNKLKEMQDDSSEGAGDALVKEVVAVDEKEGKRIIMSERRLVIVEFYTDT
ncbi:hypothetical protein HW115_11830 [Verrucomicrobiaceae bacterium N1E253]|uniref:Uncharacterized protein n=1 Tax=Oceaniferula marina TaxID=2748318 RepID=A0A851GFK0_9BACT|nr:hypothetical protein [Oceaniferula marina]NWK56303.1 hypothetical protein [Oceaniferula marina]